MNYKGIIFFLFVFLSNLTLSSDIYSLQEEKTEYVCRQSDYYYRLLQSFLNQYQRPFTMLDIGADQGYYSLRTAQDYAAVCVMIESNDQLLENCKAHQELTNLILLNTSFSPAKLQHLSECEHFDVVLALKGMHEFGKQWEEAANAILRMGDYVFIKIPADEKDVEEYVFARGGKILGDIQDDNSTLYLIETKNIYLRRKTWLRSIMSKNLYRIESSFFDKQLIKPSSWPTGALKATSWIPGINLCTFKMCHGAYPTKDQLRNCMIDLKDFCHTDWIMNNMIVQGKTLALIDFDDELSNCYFCETLLEAHLEMLNLEDPEKIEHYFWHKLFKIPISKRHRIKFFNQLFPPLSLVFDIGTSDEILIDRYLEYGAKVICCNPIKELIQPLRMKSKQESLYLTSDSLLKQKGNHTSIIDSMISFYGVPHFCNINVPAGSAYNYISDCSQPIGCIAFKFDISCEKDMIACLNHLTLIGYKQFNFSARDLPGLILENNHYINVHKDWARSTEELLSEIQAFARLDHDPTQLWGYIYVR